MNITITIPRLTDEHLIDICKKLKRETNNEIDFNLMLNEELKQFNVTRNASVCWDKSGRMAMGMIFGVKGEVLNF